MTGAAAATRRPYDAPAVIETLHYVPGTPAETMLADYELARANLRELEAETAARDSRTITVAAEERNHNGDLVAIRVQTLTLPAVAGHDAVAEILRRTSKLPEDLRPFVLDPPRAGYSTRGVWIDGSDHDAALELLQAPDANMIDLYDRDLLERRGETPR